MLDLEKCRYRAWKAETDRGGGGLPSQPEKTKTGDRRTPTAALDSASGWCLRWRKEAEAILIAQESTDGIDVDTVPPRTFARRMLALETFLFRDPAMEEVCVPLT